MTQEREEIEAALLAKVDAQYIVSQMQGMPLDIAEQFANDIAAVLWNAMRSRSLEDAKQFVQMRVLSSGSAVTTTAAGNVVGHGGTNAGSYFDIMDFRGGALSIEPGLGRQVNIRLGGGTDCMFDHLVSSCWATEVAAGRGTEGQTFTSLTGCTFQVWSTIQGAWNTAKDTASIQTIFICPGGGIGQLAISTDTSSTAVFFVGANRDDSFIPGNGATAAVTITGGTRRLYFKDLGFAAVGAGDRCFSKTSGTQDIYWDNCRLGSASERGPVITSAAGGTLEAWDCLFPSNQAGVFAMDFLNNAFYSQFRDCVFNNTVRPGKESHFFDCTFNQGTTAKGIVVADMSGSTSIHVTGCHFRTSAAAFTYYIEIDRGSISFTITGCDANTGATAAVFIGANYATTNGQQAITGNAWSCDLGIDHTTSSSAMVLNYSGNRHSGTLGATSTGSPIIANGKFSNSKFAGNGPARARITFVAGSGINMVDGVQSTSGTPSHQAQEGTLYWDTSANIMYVNTDGGTTWAAILTSGSVSTFFSVVEYVFVPDAAVGVTVTSGNQQGALLHSGPTAETATRIYLDMETAPGAAGQDATIQYGDTDDLDTVASWTTIATVNNGNGVKSNLNNTMTNASIPADRLLRCNWSQSEGADGTATLRAKRPLTV